MMKTISRVTRLARKKCSQSLLYPIAVVLLFLLAPCSANANHRSGAGIHVAVNQQRGQYTINIDHPRWSFQGGVGTAFSDVKSANGHDKIGAYQQISFQWRSDNQYIGAIRWYKSAPIVVFTLRTPQGATHIKTAFPDFKKFPKSMHHYSFRDKAFAPPAFNMLTQTSTPWLFFNNRDDAFILSPASDFIVAKMRGHGRHSIASGLNPRLKHLPNNFAHKTILVLSHGINNAWLRWGRALMAMYGKKAPTNEADPVLKYYGYWTDNGARYYYNYNKKLGYSATLRAIERQYKKEGIRLGYMQLDSWWYEKSIYGPNGKPDAGHKNKQLPRGRWNRYGGLMRYRADKFVFPHGLAGFHRKLKLPLVTHNRWIDPHSLYHKKYDITGYAAIDPKFWNHIASYIRKAGVIDYEQDWLSYIYTKTPRMASDLTVGNAFTNAMANAMQSHGLDMQYCMAMPRFFMQGVKYHNLTTIRDSGDRFERAKWRHFIYTSQLGYALGIWPWSDVFMSHETGNMIVSVLSAGAVGTGDALGQEDKHNIMLASRPDGVLVKPDAALVPMDADYINAARKANKPMLAWTYTHHGALSTDYVFAFTPNGKASKDVAFKPATLGQTGSVVVYDPLTHAAKRLPASHVFNDTLGKTGYTYYLVAPVTASGIAFLGDEGKIAATGKQRIESMHASKNALQIKVAFASGEQSVTLHGYSGKPVKTNKGKLTMYSGKSVFDLVLHAPKNAAKTVTVRLRTKEH